MEDSDGDQHQPAPKAEGKGRTLTKKTATAGASTASKGRGKKASTPPKAKAKVSSNTSETLHFDHYNTVVFPFVLFYFAFFSLVFFVLSPISACKRWMGRYCGASGVLPILLFILESKARVPLPFSVAHLIAWLHGDFGPTYRTYVYHAGREKERGKGLLFVGNVVFSLLDFALFSYFSLCHPNP